MFDGINNGLKNFVNRYSVVANVWKKVAGFPYELSINCVTAYMDKVFFFGGSTANDSKSCLEFDTKDLNRNSCQNVRTANFGSFNSVQKKE